MRIRITFSKAGPMQYVGHLDLHRAWERAFRRSGLPLAYSLGFHPQPRLNLACALPLGFTSQCELIDAWLEQDHPLEEIIRLISSSVPPGLTIHGIEPIEIHEPAIQTQVSAAIYTITFLDHIQGLDDRLQGILTTEHLPRRRRDKPYDLRPLIENITFLSPGSDGHQRVSVQLSARDSATGRPEELLAEMGINLEDTRIHREKLIFRS